MGFFGNLLGSVAKGAARGALNGNVAGGIVNQVTGVNNTPASNPQGLPRGRMKSTDKVKGKDSPLTHDPMAYRIKDKETNKILYTGITDDGRRRGQQHQRSGKFDPSKHKLEYSQNKNYSTETLQKIEKQQIERHSPPGNTYKGGNGRTPNKNSSDN